MFGYISARPLFEQSSAREKNSKAKHLDPEPGPINNSSATGAYSYGALCVARNEAAGSSVLEGMGEEG